MKYAKACNTSATWPAFAYWNMLGSYLTEPGDSGVLVLQ